MLLRLAVRIVVLAFVIGLVAKVVPGIRAILGLTAAASRHLSINGFWAAVLGALIITVCSWLAEVAFPVTRRKQARR